MFEEELASERRFLDQWLENNFPQRRTSTPPLWNFRDDASPVWRRESVHLFSWEAGSSVQDNWQNTTKSFQVLTFLCSEVLLLEKTAQKKFYPMLYVMGGSLVRGHAPPMGDLELQLASLLPTLQDVLDYLGQLDSLLDNLLTQTSAILLDDGMDIDRQVVRTALKCASKGLVVLFCLQTLLSIRILPLFFNYRRMLHTMMSKAKPSPDQTTMFETVQDQVVKLEESLRMGAFTSFVDGRIKHGALGRHFQRRMVSSLIEKYLLEQIAQCCSQLDTSNESVLARSDLLAALLLSVAYCWAGGYPKDKRVVKAALEIHQKAPLLPLCYSLVVVPCRFLLDMLPSSCLGHFPCDYLKQCTIQSHVYLQNLQKSLAAKLDRTVFQGAAWASELSALLTEGGGVISAADREQFMEFMMEGLHLMTHLKRSLDGVIQLHVEQLQPMSKDTLRCVTSCICQLKLLSGHIARSWRLVEENLEFFLEHYKSKLLDQFKRLYDHLLQLERTDKTLQVRRVLSRFWSPTQHSPYYLTVCMKLTKMGIQTLQEKATTPQRLLLTLIVHAMSGFHFVPDHLPSESMACLKQLEIVEQMAEWLQTMGRCDMLYFHPELMRNAFHQLLQHPEEANKLPHLVNGFLDIRFLADEAGMEHINPTFEQSIQSMLKMYFLDPLVRIVERDLLTIVCGDVSTQSDPPDDDIDCSNNMLPLLQIDPLSLVTKDLNIREAVSVRLSKTLTRRSLREDVHWDVLCKVKNIAQEKYGVVVMQPDASEGSTPSLLDRLNTTEGINGFVASYMFQLHTFTFVLSPRTPFNHNEDLLEVVSMEEFMEMIQADITQVGPAALKALHLEQDDEDDAEFLTKESDLDGPVSSEKSDAGRQDPVPDELPTVTSTMTHHDSFKQSTSAPAWSGSVLNPGRAPWSFLEKNQALYYQESIGSGTSLRPAPRSTEGETKEGGITVLTRRLTDALTHRLKQVAELCGVSETRSVLTQTRQRWLNSQRAVDNLYPVPQAELVRKEVIALLKAGTLTTNIIHKLRFLIGDIGRLVSMVMMVFHAASGIRERTFSMLPRHLMSNAFSLKRFVRQVSEYQRLVSEAVPFDTLFPRFEPKSSVRSQYMCLLESTFEAALDESQLEVLRNIFILTPAMTLDHIESMRSLKNQYQGNTLNKVTAHTDDSFAVGLSFLLSMLNQLTKVESFHWFESAVRQYRNRLDRVNATLINQRSNSVTTAIRRTTDLETQRNLDIAESLKGNVREMKLLERSIMCGKLFFRKRDHGRSSSEGKKA